MILSEELECLGVCTSGEGTHTGCEWAVWEREREEGAPSHSQRRADL